MDNQIILACDDNGKFLEYIPKAIGHTGEGRRHIAITVLLFNSKNQVLLQKRKHQVFNNLWDFTASTHPLHKEGEADETLEQATLRSLKMEYDIDNHINLDNLGSFNYFAQNGKFCENEHCAMMLGQYEGEVNLDPKVGYECKWVDLNDFFKDVSNNPNNYAPWVIEGVKVLKKEFACNCC